MSYKHFNHNRKARSTMFSELTGGYVLLPYREEHSCNLTFLSTNFSVFTGGLFKMRYACFTGTGSGAWQPKNIS
jgi:hypothetical protein